ncbi:hypothetical protein [Halobellus sp. GM3]|uniref:hypothetical protein n=1 Tax=Halobellus sp. GM3 TaxID=3458410 RepID=UPI00403DA104
MSREEYRDAKNYTIEWDSDVESVIHTWTRFSTGQAFRDGLDEALEAIRYYGSSRIIFDTSNIKAHSSNDKEWLQTEWLPDMLDAGVDSVATVHADSSISASERRQMQEEMSSARHDQFVTEDLETARDWMDTR